MGDNKYSNHDAAEQKYLLEMIRASQEQQHMETALALSLQESLLTTRMTRTNHKHQTIPCGTKHQHIQDVVLGEPHPQNQFLVRRQIQQEQCRILERIREKQEAERMERLLVAFQLLNDDETAPTQEHELFQEHDDPKSRGRTEKSTRRKLYDESIPKTAPDLQLTLQQENLETPLMVTGGPHCLRSITASNDVPEDSNQEGTARPRQVLINLQQQSRRKTLRRWKGKQALANQEQEVPVVVPEKEGENRMILQRMLQEHQPQQQCRILETRITAEPVHQSHERPPRHVPMTDIIISEPNSNHVPTQQHLEPPRVVAIPQGSLHQNAHVSGITMDPRIAQEEDGQGQILIKMGRLSKPQPKPMLLSNDDLIVTCQGCQRRVQVDCSFSMVFCPKCCTVSPAVPVACVTFVPKKNRSVS